MGIFSLQAKTEASGYAPWVNFTNTALYLLTTKRVTGLRERNSKDDIIMQRTDPSVLRYHHNGTLADRKPDIIFLKLKQAQLLHGTNENWKKIAQACAAKPPTGAKQKHIDRRPDDAGVPSFDWSDVLFFSEHKHATHSPKSFEDLLVLEKLRAPAPPSAPGQSFPTYDLPPFYLTLSPQFLLKAKSGASKRSRDLLALVEDPPVSAYWCNVCYSH